MNKSLSIIIIVLVSVSCENPLTYEWDAAVDTDARQYTFPDIVWVTVSANPGNPVLVEACGGTAVFDLQRQGVQWNTIAVAECGVDHDFIVLQSGQSHSFMIDLSILGGASVISGIYRVRLPLYSNDDAAVLLPEHMRTSNTFTVIEVQSGDT
jgi:hypothetical protein